MSVDLCQKDKRNAFLHHNFMVVEYAENEECVVRLDIRPESLNPLGVVHGGAISALADNATGIAAHTDGRSHVTQTSSMHFLRNQGQGTIRGKAKVRHRGNATCLVGVDIVNEEGTLLATGEFTLFCIDQERVKAKAQKK